MSRQPPIKQSLLLLFFLILLLPFSLLASKQVQNLRSKAEIVSPNILINTQNRTGPFANPFCALAQGGETTGSGLPVTFQELIPELSRINPCYIRIDHLYDLYAKVTKNKDGISVDWSRLDRTLNDITATGAVPFISLSYMPMALSVNGDITGEPTDWNDWEELIRLTIEHISGFSGKNISRVHYEVWNEPDLFGNWRINGNKDYLTLYRHTADGAARTHNTTQFFIGGPSVTHPMESWISGFLSFVREQNLRLDFLSWHRYTLNPTDLSADTEKVKSWGQNYPAFPALPLFITEYGSDSENNPIHDSDIDAYHTLATLTYLDPSVKNIFSFEIKDGPSPLKEQYWGRWGLYTNDSNGIIAKPRFEALKFLSTLSGEKVQTSGNGTYITSAAFFDGTSYKTLVVYYLPPGTAAPGDMEAVTIVFKDLPRGIYQTSQKEVFGAKEILSTDTAPIGIIKKVIPMKPNSAVLITLTKTGELATYEPGRRGGSDKALVFDLIVPSLAYPASLLSTSSGTIEYWMKFKIPVASLREEPLMTIPLANKQILLAKKRASPGGFGTEIVWGIFDAQSNSTAAVSAAVTSWKTDEWHQVAFSWSNSALKLYLDGKLVSQKTIVPLFIPASGQFTIGGFDGVIDELRISSTDREPVYSLTQDPPFDSFTTLLRHFDGKIEE